MYLCPPIGMWLKITIFCQKKGSPSEVVFSNAIIHTTVINVFSTGDSLSDGTSNFSKFVPSHIRHTKVSTTQNYNRLNTQYANA